MGRQTERMLVEVLNVSAEIRALRQYVYSASWRQSDWLDVGADLMRLERRRDDLMRRLRALSRDD